MQSRPLFPRTVRRLLTTLTPALMIAGCEDRPLPTAVPANKPSLDVVGTCVVTSREDVGGGGSLREALANPTCSTITFNLVLPATIELRSGELTIDRAVSIEGPGADKLTVAPSPLIENPRFRIFAVQAGVTSSAISKMTISGGNTAEGAGIFNAGTLTLSHVAITGNRAAFGGGVTNSPSGRLKISHSLVANNTAIANGGGVSNNGSLILEQSTFSGNTARNGGGLYDSGLSGAAITHSTFTDNSANEGGGILASGSREQLATLTIRNSIIAGNVGLPPDVSAPVVATDARTTLIGNAEGHGIVANPGSGNVIDVNARLGPLALNAPGVTATHALLAGSPAIDAGTCIGAMNVLVTDDQRGVARPQGNTCDMGAFEWVATPGDLIADVIALAAGAQGLSKGTLTKLDGARTQIAAGKIASACSKLADFLSDMQDQRGKRISTSDADALIASVQKLRTSLGC